MYRRRAPGGRQEGVVLGSGRVQLRRPGRTTVYRPIREYRLPRNESDPAPVAVAALLGLALVVVLFASGFLGGAPESVGGATATPSAVAASPTEGPTGSPTAEPTPTPTAAPTSTIHVVQKGEYLSKIADQYGVTVADIVDANELENPSQLRVGQKLVIPPPD
jgi:hypothetical protein